MKLQLIIVLVTIFSSLHSQNLLFHEYKKQIEKTNYQKGNLFVSATPYGGIIIGKQNERFGISFGHSVKYGYFIKNKLCLSIGSFQNYHYFQEVMNEAKEVSKTTTSSVSLSLRYYLLNKKFTPYFDAGFENFINYDDWEAWDNLKPKVYYVGSGYIGIGLSIPVSKFNINIAYRYLQPIFQTTDAEKYNRYSFSYGWHFEPGISYIFNKNKKALKEKYSIE